MKFTVNGSEYEGAKYDFNAHCEFDSMGVTVTQIREKTLSVARAYLAYSSGMSLEDAGNELEKHIIAGNNVGEIIGVLMKELEASDFFMALIGKQKEEKPVRITKKKEESTEV